MQCTRAIIYDAVIENKYRWMAKWLVIHFSHTSDLIPTHKGRIGIFIHHSGFISLVWALWFTPTLICCKI